MAGEIAGIQATLQESLDARTDIVALVRRAQQLAGSVDRQAAGISEMLGRLGVRHEWDGTRLRIMGPDGQFSDGADLQGPAGERGEPGPRGAAGPTGDITFEAAQLLAQANASAAAAAASAAALGDIPAEIDDRLTAGLLDPARRNTPATLLALGVI